MITIDYKDQRPIYEQIVDRYEALIISGVLEKDEQLPSVREIARELSINPNTIQKAFTILEQKGWIYSVKGRGNYVSENSRAREDKRERFKADLASLLKSGRQIGINKKDILEILDKTYGKGEMT